MAARHRHLPAGFTLIELIIVMMLMATIMGIVAPQLSRFIGGRDIKEETRRLMALTRLARSEAVARSERMVIWFNTETAEYGLRAESAVDPEGEREWTYKLPDKIGWELATEGVLVNDAGEDLILFWPDGTIDAKSLATIVLTEDGQRKEVIRLNDSRMQFVAEDAANVDLDS